MKLDGMRSIMFHSTPFIFVNPNNGTWL